ncbi:MAG: GAF domain-containing protein, partial [Bacteroidetes bacterium]|nr:GAF domain-containing protein [Bacteroidota bacterium]
MGNKFGALALDLLENPETKPDRSKTLFIVNHFIVHWKNHIKNRQKYFLEGYFVGVETGDLESAGVCAHVLTAHQFFMGMELIGVEEQMSYYGKLIKHMNQKTFFLYNEILRQIVHCFLGRAPDPSVLAGDCFDQTTSDLILSKDADKSAIIYIYLLQTVLDYFFGNYLDGLKHIDLAFKYKDNTNGTIESVRLYYTYSLLLLKLYENMSLKEKRRAMRKNGSNLKKLRKWSDHCPVNHNHKYYIIMAETARVKGFGEQAVEYYNKGIESAERNGFLQEKALGEELLAQFYLSTDQKVNARTWMNIARESYKKWGAAAKVEQLENKYPELLKKTEEHPDVGFQSINLDYHAVVNALQMISTEIILEDLLQKLMKTVVETAGADTGVFIMQKPDGLYVEAQYNMKKEGSDKSCIVGSVLIRENENLLMPVINLVARTGKYAVFDEASKEPEFVTDPHVIKNNPKSLLCLPVVRKGKSVGVLYLENNLAVGAFTQDRIDALELLAAQAAISLENAGLYKE